MLNLQEIKDLVKRGKEIWHPDQITQLVNEIEHHSTILGIAKSFVKTYQNQRDNALSENKKLTAANKILRDIIKDSKQIFEKEGYGTLWIDEDLAEADKAEK